MAYKQRGLSILLLCLIACNSVLCEEPEYYKEYMRTMQQAIDAVVEAGLPTEDNIDRTDDGVGVLFECPDLPASVTTRKAEDVHELKPYDIDVVAAMGDSLTAAMGAKASSIFDILTEYRGVSWSIGGDDTVSSVHALPNFIQEFNPDVIGYSTGKGSGGTQFNMAISGAKSKDMPDQARKLVEKLHDVLGEEKTRNYWKLVTVFIGGNDLCAHCNDASLTPENYANQVTEALDILKDNLPRTFVNVVHTLDVTVMAAMNGFVCEVIHGLVCSCKRNDATKKAAETYREKMAEEIESRRYDTDDFAVVIQPFTAGIEDVPRDDNNNADKSFFSPDCFHFSQKAHKDAALSLWNNMLEPVGEKELGWEHNPNPKCPTEEHPYFYTNRNSQSQVGSLGAAAPPAGPDSNGSGDNLLGVLLGSGIGAYVVAMAVIVAVVGTVWYRKRRQQQHGLPTRVSCDTEKITLLKN